MLAAPSVDDANQIGTRKKRTFRNRPTVTSAAALRRKLRQRACGSSGCAFGSHSPRPAASAHATASSATALGANAIVCFAYSCDRIPRPSAIPGAIPSSTLRQGTRASRSRSDVPGAGGGAAAIASGAGICSSLIREIDSPRREKNRRACYAGTVGGGGPSGLRFAHPVADARFGLEQARARRFDLDLPPELSHVDAQVMRLARVPGAPDLLQD